MEEENNRYLKTNTKLIFGGGGGGEIGKALTATSSNNSPLVPWRIFTRFPMLFSQMYNACCRADPATMYSPSPEKQHFFQGVLETRESTEKVSFLYCATGSKNNPSKRQPTGTLDIAGVLALYNYK